MFSFKRSLIVLIGQLALIVTIVALVPLVSRGQGKQNAPPPFDVKVINSPSEPIPVTGAVSVSNLGGAPLPVRDVDNAARQPFQVKINEVPIIIPNPVFFTVPAGKRLVIEYVSADIEAVSSCGSAPQYALTTTAAGVTLEHFFYTKDAGTIGSLNDVKRAFGLSQETRIYADPNTPVKLNIRTETFPTCGFFTNEGSGIRVSGYLVDVP